AGIKLLEMEKPLIMYLSLTDYIQHKYAPGEPEANRYYRDMDALFGRLHELGAVVGLVADHGMRDKCNPDSSLKVGWLEDAHDLDFVKGATTFFCRIPDYSVAVQGPPATLGPFFSRRPAPPEAVIRLARKLPGIEAPHDRTTAARLFDLPIDREGDV